MTSSHPIAATSVAFAVALATGFASAQAPPRIDPARIGARAVPFPQAGGAFGAYTTADGTIRAESAVYRASFAPAAVRIEVAAPADAVSALELRYLGCSRDAAWTGATDAVTPRRFGNRVSFAHGDVTESYEATASGVEQTFHCAERPAGRGDLHLHLAVGGDVEALPTAAPAHRALEFRRGSEPAIRYGEAVALDHGGHRVEVLTQYDGIGHLELTVPAVFVDAAVYPLVVDPAIGPVLLPGGAANNDVAPDVAHDVEQGLFLVVWQRLFAGSNGIRGALYDAAGAVVNPFIVIADGVDYAAPAVAFSHSLLLNAFLVVWQQPNGIRGRMVTAADGTLPANAFAISTPPAGVSDRRPSVSGPGDEAMMVAWDRTLASATTPNEILVRDLYWPTPTLPALVNIGPERSLEAVTTGYVLNVRLARSDVATHVGADLWYQNRAVWERFYPTPAPGDADIRTASFRLKQGPFGFVLSSLSTVPGAGNIGPAEIQPDIGARASVHVDPPDLQYLVVWEDEQDVLGQMYGAGGPVGAAITVRATPVFEGAPAVGAGHCEFTVAYLEITPPAEFDVDVYAARVLLDGTVPVNHRLVDDPGGQFQQGVRASSRPIVGPAQPRNTSLLAWMGQTGAGAGLNDVRARFFEPVAASRVLFGAACAGPLGELAAIGSSGGDPVAGNADFRVTVNGAPALSLAVLVIGQTPVSLPIPGAPGCSLYAGLPFVHIDAVVTDGAGNASVALPIPCSIPSGSFLAMQWGIFTPGHNPFGWIVSNDMDLSWTH